jgi:restriction endonuclease S subunit
MTGKKGNGSAIARVLDALTIAGGPDRKGEYRAFCPAHDDKKTPNLRIREGEDGRVLLRCFAGCSQDKVLSALAEKGIGKSDLFARNGRGGGRGSTTRDHVHACTLEAYAEAKKLPLEFLARLGLSNTSYVGKPAVRILYLKEDGSERAVRFRIALEKGPKGDERFRWRKGSKPSLYGLWRLEHARDEGYVFLVEGESDAQTLWHHGLAALGVPGAGTWRGEWTEHLEGVEKVYAVVEPDGGGEAFWQRLAASALREKLYRVELDGAGDVSELHLQDPDAFPKRIVEACGRAAAWLDIAESEAQVLLSVRAPVGPTNLAPSRCCIGRGLAAIRALDGVESRYILYAIRAFQTNLSDLATGTTFEAVTGDVVRSFEIPVAPQAEQRRIVETIEEQFSRLDAGVTALERVQTNLKRYRTAVLRAAVEGRLTEAWREENPDVEPASELLERILKERRERWERGQLAAYEKKGKKPPKNWQGKYKEPAQPDVSSLPVPPDTWVWASADQLTGTITDGEHVTPERSERGVPLLSARNVQNGWLSFDKIDHVPENVYKTLQKRLTVAAGDVLMSCSGTVGRSCVVPENRRFALVRSVAVLKPLAQMGKFISYSLRSPLLQRQINKKKTQTAQANIFQGKIRTLVLALPSLPEQEQIVAEVERRLSILQEVEAEVEANLKRASRLRQAILKRAFEGKLVPQDPTDEPASELLARIRIERERSGPAQRRKKKPARNEPAEAQPGLF